MNRRTALQAVGGVRVPEPVRADASRNSGALRSLLHNTQNSRAIQRSAGPRAEHRNIGIYLGTETQQILPHRPGEENRASLAAFPAPVSCRGPESLF